MPDGHANFAYSTVATAPSPATSGTSLVVATGNGALFPVVPFNVTIWPTGTQPTAANSEIARVTAISTDTLTIVRAQEGTTARTVVVGDQIAATVTAKTLRDIENDLPYYNIEDPAFGAIPDAFFQDGAATGASTAFTSATAAFVAGDAGKQIVILAGGVSAAQDHHTTIASVTNGTTIVLTQAAGRTVSPARFYVSRGGDSTTAIQNAINAATAAGGGTIFCPGPGYAITGLTLKNRTWLRGAGIRATMLHLLANSNVPVVMNDCTLNNSATTCAISDIWLDGNRINQSDVTTTISGTAYTAGNNVLNVAATGSFLPNGEVLIGTTRYSYQNIGSATQFTQFGGGDRGTTDASQIIGATVTQHKANGIFFGCQPYNTGGTNQEHYDPHHLIENVFIKNVKGDGIQIWGQSEARIRSVWVNYCDHWGFVPSYDTWITECTSDTAGRGGFFFGWSSTHAVACKAFYSGGNVAAEGWGFLFQGPTSIEEGTKIATALVAQDNKADGFYLRNAQRVVLQGMASSNGTGTIGAYTGVKIDGCTNGIIDVACVERVASPNNAQQNALRLLSTAISTNGMQIRISHGATAGTTVGSAITSDSVLTGGNNISINGMGGTTAPAYAATYTPDPYAATTHIIGALTGALTINAPTNAHVGCPLTIILSQDTTGGRVVTWNAIYTNAPAFPTTRLQTVAYDFIYDGTNWVGTIPPFADGIWTPADLGWKGYAYDPQIAATGLLLPTAGQIQLVGIKLKRPTSITNVLLIVTTAGATLTASQNIAGLYGPTGALIGSTADQSTAWTSAGLKTAALVGGPFLVPAGTIYVAFYANGTTKPTFARSSGTNTIYNAGVTRFAVDSTNTARTTTLPATMGTLAGSTAAMWAAVS